MIWTGQRADCLRRALGMTYEQFAEELAVAVRTVAYWQSRPESRVRDTRLLEQLYDTLDSEAYALMRRCQDTLPGRRATLDAANRVHLIASRKIAARADVVIARRRSPGTRRTPAERRCPAGVGVRSGQCSGRMGCSHFQ